ncbi:MAG: DUF5320 domain-containing protein [Bacteroidales bacterium]|nr:DUF5320 domain-containing protein [Bacteroidales bacterium]
MSEGRETNIIKRLQNSVSLLKESYLQVVEDKTAAETELESLRGEVEALKRELAESKAQLNDIKAKQQRLITARGFVAEEGDIKSARLRVSRLVREIDKCISLLNQ